MLQMKNWQRVNSPHLEVVWYTGHL